eukprot:36028-Ditylum_brightwellii.AAC.1
MSAWCPQTTNMGHIPNIKFTECKLESLGAEFKSICCAIAGIMLALHIQRGMRNTAPLQFSSLNVITVVSLCLASKAKLCGQEKPTVNKNENKDEDEEDRIGNFSSSDLFQGSSWFASISIVEHMMELRRQFKGIVKTAHCLYPKD